MDENVRASMTPERLDVIRGAAETRQWSCDAEAAEMMLELLDDHARLAAELCDVLAERDAMQAMATQNGRERNRAEAEVARLRRLLDVIDQACGHNRPERCAESLAAEIERLTVMQKVYDEEIKADNAYTERLAAAVGVDPIGDLDGSQVLAAVERIARERDAARAEVERFWGLLCETVEALGCVAPEAAPYAPGWAAKMREERDRLATEVAEASAALDHVVKALGVEERPTLMLKVLGVCEMASVYKYAADTIGAVNSVGVSLLRNAVADRDRLAAALAEVRDEALTCGVPRVTRLAAAAVADLATARDARVRAEAVESLPWGALAEDAKDPNHGRSCLHCGTPIRAGRRYAHACRPEAERIERGGR